MGIGANCLGVEGGVVVARFASIRKKKCYFSKENATAVFFKKIFLACTSKWRGNKMSGKSCDVCSFYCASVVAGGLDCLSARSSCDLSSYPPPLSAKIPSYLARAGLPGL